MANEKASDGQGEEALEKYSVFSTANKWCIVAMVSYAAWFSTLTSFIYYPAIHQLAQTFAVSIDKINLTITSYMAMATVAPTLLGDAADVLGRRPVYMLALSLYIGANIAIVLSNSYAALVGLRVLQALAISVGNGSISPPKYLRLPISACLGHSSKSDTTAGRMWRMPNPLRSLTIIARKDNTVIILACGMLYAVYTCINTSLSVLFIDIYTLTQWQAGLIYLPFGIGGTVSTFFSGHLLDKAYRDARTKRGLSTNKSVGDNLDIFPVEKARLGIIWAPMLVTACSVLAFGWVLHFHYVGSLQPSSDQITGLTAIQHIAIPLCLQFIVGLCMQLDFSVSLYLHLSPACKEPEADSESSRSITPS
ncbi:MAG: hypothetical protein Q9205_002700 [Flavoplaca limonia]